MHPVRLSPTPACLLALGCLGLVSAAVDLQQLSPAAYQLSSAGYQLEDQPPDPLYQLPVAAALQPQLQGLQPELQGERWQHVIPDPKLYLLTETAQNDQDMPSGGPYGLARRLKRTNGPSLSIVNPLDVLRQRLLLEIARRRMRQSEDQVIANRQWLKTIGKRSIDQQSLREMEKSSNLDHGNHGRDGHS